MSFSAVKALHDERLALHDMAQRILAKPNLTPQDKEHFNQIMSDMDALKGKIDRHNATDPGVSFQMRSVQQESLTRKPSSRIFTEFLRRGLTPDPVTGSGGLSLEERQLFEAEQRDMGTGGGNALQGSGGGYFVPVGFSDKIETAMKWYGGMMESSTILDTATGNPLPYPTSNDTATSAELVTEGTQVSTADVNISSILFGSYKYSSKMVKVSMELLQDSYFPIEDWLAGEFGIRFGRKLNRDFTVGVGTTEPFGIVTQATLGATAIGAATNTGGSDSATNTIGSTDLFELEHSVDKAYRKGAKYMMHDTTLKVIKEVLDKYGRPLWKPGLNAADPDTINGYAYVINNDMATPAASAKTVLFGALDKYLIRRVKQFQLLRLVERFADYGQVAFLGFARYDGNLLDAGTRPVRYLIQHS